MTNPDPEPVPDTGTDDEDIAAFAEEYDGLRAKVAELDQRMSGLDEIGAKLDQLLKGQTGGRSNTSGNRTSQPGGAARGGTSGASGTRAPQGQPQPPEGGAGAIGGSGGITAEKKPESDHWYYKKLPWKRD